MSGRLVILPHKSWNVWNQDNKEKVMRDQRLFNEELQRKADNEKRQSQEMNLQILQQSATSTEEASANESANCKPFRLFEDIEQKAGNEEYLKEKKKKEELAKKKEGIADWALGEGSRESKKIVPWYESLESISTKEKKGFSGGKTADVAPAVPVIPSYLLERNLTEEDRRMAEDRELGRKRAEDPMTKYCVYETGGDAAKNQSGSSRLFHDASQIEAKDATDTVVEEEDIHNRKQQRRKKHRRNDLLATNPAEMGRADKRVKKEHKHRHHRRQEEEEDDEGNDQRDSSKLPPSLSSSSSLSSLPSDRHRDSGAGKPISMMDELRQRRLQREKQERKRTNILLANVDIFGAGTQHHSDLDAAGDSYQYHQQFHPHLLKDKKHFGLTKR